MAGFGWSELAIIGILVIVFVGPKDLPKLLRFLGRTYGKVRRASEDLRKAFTLEVDKVDAEARAAEIQRRREALIERRRAEAEARKKAGGAVPKPLPEAPSHTQAAEQALDGLAQKKPAAEDAAPAPAPAAPVANEPPAPPKPDPVPVPVPVAKKPKPPADTAAFPRDPPLRLPDDPEASP